MKREGEKDKVKNRKFIFDFEFYKKINLKVKQNCIQDNLLYLQK